MTKVYNIAFQLENPILIRLLEEQISGLKFLTCDPSLRADCIIVHEGALPLKSETATFLSLPKGAVRLGDVIDRLRYLLSGRETHLEEDPSSIDLGHFLFFPAENTLIVKTGNLEIRLTDKERMLLRFLHQAGEKGMSRQDLLKLIWGYAEDIETHTLETHIYRLRQKLEPYQGQNLIKAVDGSYVLSSS